MSELVTVFGFGPVGKSVAEEALASGRRVRVVQRKRPADLIDGVEFASCDVLDAAAVMAAVAGAGQIVVTVGFQYDGAVWLKAWPRAMANLLAACEAHGARMVFVDNLYMYGAQDAPLREDMGLTATGRKPAARAEATRLWQAAKGRVKVAALRAPDFYGPGVTLSHLGDTGFRALAEGKAATLLVSPDLPHDFAYVPDLGRAVVALLDAPDDAFGQAWHMPSAPTRTPRQLLAMGAEAIGAKLKVTALPMWMLPVLGAFMPFARELWEMRFQWDRPYHVDARRFTERFGFVVTPFETGVARTVRSFGGGV